MDWKRIRVGLFTCVGTLMTLLAVYNGRSVVGGLEAIASVASWIAALCFVVVAARRN